VPILAHTSGQVFARKSHALVRRGAIIIKIAGETVLAKRAGGQMLTN